ncbi:MAG: Ig-like domain-containing protein [Oscillospiraceae bacterium]|nr:Ig-like domain-containing protein [Oscillospiraceae bacterium]
MNNKVNKVVIAALSISLLLTSCDMDSFFNGDKETDSSCSNKITTATLQPDVNELVSDGNYKMMSVDETADFAVRLSEADISSGNIPQLCSENDGEICSLTDDGTGADEVAHDGIFTCSASVRSDDGVPQSYYVSTGNHKTNEIKMTYFDELTPEDCKQLEKVEKQFDKAEEAYTKNGYTTNKAAAVLAAEETAEKLYESGEAVEYRSDPESGSVYVKLSSGIAYIYETTQEGYDGSSGSDDTTADHSVSVLTAVPIAVNFNDGSSTFRIWVNEGAQEIVDTFDSISFAGTYCSGNVTRALLCNLTQNQILLWSGHGGYSESAPLRVQLGEIFSVSEVENSSDYINERITVTRNGKLCFTSKFVDEYCGDLTNTLIYLGCCHTGEVPDMANSFLDKGAALYIGNSGVIESSYNASMIKYFAQGLTKRNMSYNDPSGYKSANDALEYAFDINEKKDVYPIIFGNGAYNLKGVIRTADNAAPGTQQAGGSLKISSSYFSMDTATTNNLTISDLPQGYELSDFVWSSENPSVATVDTNGVVTAVRSGSTIIRVESGDSKYSQFCAVTVH